MSFMNDLSIFGTTFGGLLLSAFSRIHGLKLREIVPKLLTKIFVKFFWKIDVQSSHFFKFSDSLRILWGYRPHWKREIRICPKSAILPSSHPEAFQNSLENSLQTRPANIKLFKKEIWIFQKKPDKKANKTEKSLPFHNFNYHSRAREWYNFFDKIFK